MSEIAGRILGITAAAHKPVQ